MIQKIISRLFLFSVIFVFLGCDQANKAFDETNKSVTNAQKTVDKYKKDNESSPVVIVKRGFYVDTKPVELGQPSWMNKQVNFKGQNVPFSFIIGQILRNTNAIVSYQEGVVADKIISMNYSGSVKGALDNLAIQSDCAYTVIGNQISWASFITKNINISFMPGSSAYNVGGIGQQSTERGQATAISTLNDSQNSTLQGSLSVWKDLKETLNNLKSKDGTVSVSESTTTVMVHDHPSNVLAIEDYIKELNREMSRQVELKVKVLQIDLNDSHQYGIDWNVVQDALGTQFSLVGNSAENITLSGVATTASQSKLGIGNTSGSNAIIQALGLQGKLSIITEPTVVTLNNQIAEVRITRDTSYLEEVDTTMATEGSTSTSITPGVVTDGFTLYLLPKIEGEKVYLQISSAISTLKSIDSVNTQGQTNTDSSSSSQDTDTTAIQVPSITEKRFNMRSAVHNHETLIIAGYKQLQDEISTSSTFGSTILGGRGSEKQNTETILLITPTIIEN